jgi:hypothetical protein
VVDDDNTSPQEWVYRVSPFGLGWTGEAEARDMLDEWLRLPLGTGVPSITVSRRPVDAETAQMLIPCGVCGHTRAWHRKSVGCSIAPRCTCDEFHGPVQTPAEASPTTVYLATPCGTCGHALNWHHFYTSCTVPRCTCDGFHGPND